MTTDHTLRPVERRVLALVHEGVDETEIARRFRRSPEMIGRLVVLAQLPRSASPAPPEPQPRLRPLERRVLRWRDNGADYADFSPRFGRTARFVEQVEMLARYKLNRHDTVDPEEL